MGTPNSPSNEVLDYVLGNGSLYRPLVAEEYIAVLDDLMKQIRPRLRYYGFKELSAGSNDEYDAFVARRFGGMRLKQIYIESINSSNGIQRMFYLSSTGTWLMVEVGRMSDPSSPSLTHYSHWIGLADAVSWDTFRWVDLTDLTGLLGETSASLYLGECLYNGLRLLLLEAIQDAEDRLNRMRNDLEYATGVWSRMQRLS